MFKKAEVSPDAIKFVVPCKEYCSYLGKKIAELENEGITLNCEDCFSTTIVEGILICENCNRWYPIIGEIPRMLPDELRNKRRNVEFLIENRTAIPESILANGKPFNLSE